MNYVLKILKNTLVSKFQTCAYMGKFFYYFNCLYNDQKQSPDVFYKKAFLKKFAIFTEKHLCWSFFLIKLQALILQYLQENICVAVSF